MSNNDLIKDDIGERVKEWESKSESYLDKSLPVIIRLDGRGFSKWTKQVEKPFDFGLHNDFVFVTMKLMDEVGACYAYTSSDEISLVVYSPGEKSQLPFGGRIQKMVSLLSSFCTIEFKKALDITFPDNQFDAAMFDCRVFNVPSCIGAVDTIKWRELDAMRNSVQLYARTKFSAKQLHGLKSVEMRQKIVDAGMTPWEDRPVEFKIGTAVQIKTVSAPFSQYELENLPAKHEARNNPDLIVTKKYDRYVEPALYKCSNPVDVVFSGADPVAVSQTR